MSDATRAAVIATCVGALLAAEPGTSWAFTLLCGLCGIVTGVPIAIALSQRLMAQQTAREAP